MGILMKRLEKGKTYWVCELPTLTTPFLQPQLMTLTDVIYDKSKWGQGRNYEHTYKFGELEIPTFMDNVLKCYMVSIDNFIITEESAKMQMVIRNNINATLYKDKKINKNLNIKAIKAYISEVDTNQPQLLI